VSWFRGWGAKAAGSVIHFWSETQRSGRWPAVRDRFARNKACSACGRGDGLEVHHVQPFHLEPSRELDPSNLLALCRPCHLFVGHLGSWESHNPAAVEDAAAWLSKIKARP